MRKQCLNKEENERDCPCKEKDCENHGICCLCLRYHRKEGGKPACFR
ncbi:MAG: hypothetical protein N3D20_02670 [Candidatus Pacearchaeota archaeon]|nr:hypothetical protein [Candidatus Pacearchaeota archaeon]